MSNMKERLRVGTEPLAGFINIIPSPVATQALAAAGADWLIIDQEHGPDRSRESARDDCQYCGNELFALGPRAAPGRGIREDGPRRRRRGDRVSPGHHC